MANDSYTLTGGNGGHVINSGEGVVTGPFMTVQAIGGDATIALTSANIGNVGDLTSLSDGQAVFGTFQTVACSSGTVVAYKR